MYMHGIDPKLDFADITETARVYTEYTDMSVNPRSPYGGALVFAAFSGSHQDAIAKGLKHKAVAEQTANYPYWNVPYLAIDPSDVGRELETDVIRINSQSGKGGVGYILERGYGYNLPPKFREAVGYAVKDYADKTSSQLNPDTVFSVFKSEFINVETPYKFTRIKTKKMNTADSRETRTELFVVTNNTPKILTGYGDGPLDAAVNALHGEPTLPDFTLTDYASHTLAAKQDAEGVSYVEITDSNGKKYYGAGVDTDTTNANIRALLSAVNKL
jgi:2-isopropylmalate synthase